ncbi:MAG TPA: endonuclease V [Pantanalinema sp.]
MSVELHQSHRWDLPPYEAQQLQHALSQVVVVHDDCAELTLIAGVEVAHSRFNDTLTVGVALLTYPDLQVVEKRTIEYQTKFPFIAELLSFREAPAVVAALETLSRRPDLVMIEGPGIAHAKGLGVASHVGVVTGLPTVGCAKATSVGSFVEPEVSAGSASSLVWQGEIIGTVYRSKNRVAPLFVSAGNRISRESAVRLVRECCQGYRMPEPIRHAGNALSENKRAAVS